MFICGIESTEKIITDIKDKNILLLSSAFFSYENVIAKKMREMGAEVDLYDARSVTSARDRALLKISPNIFYAKTVKYYEKIISDNIDKCYDYILIITCDMTPIEILKTFRKVYPQAKLCLYLWDSVKNSPGIIEKLKYFDIIHSFDSDDCKKYAGLKFRPLFFSDEFCKEPRKVGHKYDISFLGTIHSDRYSVIRQIRSIAAKKGLRCYWFCYLQSEFIYYFYKLTKKTFWRTRKSDFSFEKMNRKDIAQIVDVSKVVIDVQHPNQSGLTMRTVEMLGMNKKLITTNSSIREYNFYNPSNILIVDRNNVVINEEFFKEPYKKPSPEIYQKYRISEWILEILS